jgi:hypothetical protein
MNFLTYLYRRLALHWQVLLTLTLGIILAVALLAVGPLMVESVLDYSMRRILITSESLEAHLRMVTSIHPEGSIYKALNDQIDDVVFSHLERYLDQIIPTRETGWTYPWV